MAFTQETFSPVSVGSTESPTHWSYSTADNLAEVNTPGYFNEKRFQMRSGDLVYINAADAAQIVQFNGADQVPTPLAPTTVVLPSVVLSAQSTTLQEPTELNAPIKVSFGPAQGEPTDPVQLDAGGNITINQPGVYQVLSLFSVTRSSSGGEALIMIRGLVNGVQFDNPVAVLIDDDENTLPLTFTSRAIALAAGQVITVEFVRDGGGGGTEGGANDGSLTPRVSDPAVGWGTSSSASINVIRFS